MSDWDPREDGALCDKCVLCDKGEPVMSKTYARATADIVVGYPTLRDVQDGKPLAGRVGMEVKRVLDEIGLRKSDFNYHLAIACTIPGNNYARMEADWRKANKKLKADYDAAWVRREKTLRRQGATIKEAKKQVNAEKRAAGKVELLPHPIECCKPRLTRDLAASRSGRIIPMGKEAMQAVLDRDGGIMDVQATLQEGVWNPETGDVQQGENLKLPGYIPVKVAPTVAPSFVLSRARWRTAFMRSVKRAVDWFDDKTQWTEPKAVGTDPARPPTPVQIRRWYHRHMKRKGWCAYDTETNKVESLRAIVQCVQFGLPGHALVIPLMTRQPREGQTVKRKDKGRVVRLQVPPSEARWHPYFYDPATLAEVRFLVWQMLRDPDVLRYGHNAALYDRIVMEQNFCRWFVKDRRFARKVCKSLKIAYKPKERKEAAETLLHNGFFTPLLTADTLLLHRLCDPDMPHGLGICGAYYTPVIDWKANKGNGWQATTDEDLYVYGGRDAAGNADIVPPVLEHCARVYPNQDQLARVIQHDMDLTGPCVEMKRLGFLVDQQERARLQASEQVKANEGDAWMAQALYQSGLTQLAGKTSSGTYYFKEDRKGKPLFNSNSPQQVGELLFEKWALNPPENLISPFDPGDDDFDSYDDWLNQGMEAGVYTASGSRSTGDAIIRAHLAELAHEQDADPWLPLFFRGLRRKRKAIKLIGDKLEPSRLLEPHLYDSEGYPLLMKGGGKWPVTAVWADGVLRTSWKPGTGVGRLASGDPLNGQNWKYYLKSMLIAQPGHSLVGADYEQFHLAIVANVWGIPRLLKVFAEDGDPHASMAAFAFGERFRQADGYAGDFVKPKKGTEAGRARELAKPVQYGGLYGAEPETIHPIVQKMEDPQTGELIYLNISLREIKKVVSDWRKAEPELEAGWAGEVALFEKLGYLEDRILGRRNWFRDSETQSVRNKLYNYRIIAEEAAVAGRATIDVYETLQRVPWRTKHTGIVEQCHDSIVIQVPDEHAEWAKRMLEETMTYRPAGDPVTYKAFADVGKKRSQVA